MVARSKRNGRPIHYDDTLQKWLYDDSGDMVLPIVMSKETLEDAIPADAIRIEYADVAAVGHPNTIEQVRIVVYKAAIVDGILKALGIEIEAGE